jgi:hypothetical protein
MRFLHWLFPCFGKKDVDIEKRPKIRETYFAARAETRRMKSF